MNYERMTIFRKFGMLSFFTETYEQLMIGIGATKLNQRINFMGIHMVCFKSEQMLKKSYLATGMKHIRLCI